jgi:hypothetical protein
MPSYKFDITDKTIDFVAKTIQEMPGNPGQQVLVSKLIEKADGQVIVTVTVDEESVDIESSGYIKWQSNHPEAIEIIIDTAEQNTELFTNQAMTPGPWDLVDAVSSGNWKVVGYDQGSKYGFLGTNL